MTTFVSPSRRMYRASRSCKLSNSAICCSFILNSSAYFFRLNVASLRKRNEVQEFTMLSAFSPRSSADWPIMVTPPRFFRTVLMEASAPSRSCLFFIEEKISSIKMCLGTPRLAGLYKTSLMRRSSHTISGSIRSAYC